MHIIRTALLLTIVLSVALSAPSRAQMMKCMIKSDNEKILNYFNKKDSKERKRCLDTAVPVVTANGTRIQNTYHNSLDVSANDTAHTQPTSQPKSQSTTKKTKKKSGYTYQTKGRTTVQIVSLGANAKKNDCASKGGTITINGRIFHIDPNSLCNRYHRSKHVKLALVNTKFRKEISPYVNKIAKQYGVDAAFVHAIISAESAYNPNATSPVGAMGLMQLMPFTADRFGVKNAYDPHQNIRAGIQYLQLLLKEFGSFELAAAGYNAGEGAVRKYKRIPPYRETLEYVPKVMAYYKRYKKNKKLIAQR